MDANKYPSDYEEALDYIEELEDDIKYLKAMLETDNILIGKYKELVTLYKEKELRSNELIAKYEELIKLYKKELGE